MDDRKALVLQILCVVVLSGAVGCARSSNVWLVLVGEAPGGARFHLMRFQEGRGWLPPRAPRDELDVRSPKLPGSGISVLVKDMTDEKMDLEVRAEGNRIWLVDPKANCSFAAVDFDRTEVYPDWVDQPAWATADRGTLVEDVQDQVKGVRAWEESAAERE
jgi:hypothetical protein